MWTRPLAPCTESTNSHSQHTWTIKRSPHTPLPLADPGMVSGGSNLHIWCCRSVFISGSHMDKRASIYPCTCCMYTHTHTAWPLYVYFVFVSPQVSEQINFGSKQTKQILVSNVWQLRFISILYQPWILAVSSSVQGGSLHFQIQFYFTFTSFTKWRFFLTGREIR